MIADTDTAARPQTRSLLRFLVFVAGGAAALFWILIAYASVTDALPVAKGVRVALHATLVFLLLVWPGLILAICNVATGIAITLVGAAAAIYAAMYLAYLPKPSGTIPLLLAALLVVLFGTFWMFGRNGGSAVEPAFEQATSRLVVLYGAGLGTVLWLSSFVPVIEVAGKGRGDGFEVIPAFCGTIFYFVFVLPLLVIGLRGTEQRHAPAVRALLVLTFAVTLIFGAPQLFR
jgi:hypothetical protein